MIGALHALDLTFLPVPARPAEGVLFLYAPGNPGTPPQSAAVAAVGLGGWLLRLEPKTAVLKLAGGRVASVMGLALKVPDALPGLVRLKSTRPRPAPASIRAWSQAAKLALELAGREEMVPTVRHDERRTPRATWAMALLQPGDRERRALLAAAMPPSACAAVVDAMVRPPRAWDPAALLSAFFDAVADSFVRAASQPNRNRSALPPSKAPSWEARMVRALLDRDNSLPLESHADAGLAASFAAWSAPLLEEKTRTVRLALSLVAPPGESAEWRVEYALQLSETGELVDAERVWRERAQVEPLLRGLAEAARISPPIEQSLNAAAPVGATLSTDEAWVFLSRTAQVLATTGVAIFMPPGLEDAARKRLRARVRLKTLGGEVPAPQADGQPALGMAAIAQYEWEVALGDDTLSEEEFQAITRLQAPLVKWRGQWVTVHPADLERSRLLLKQKGGVLPTGSALAALVSGEAEIGGESVEVVADGDLAGLAGWLAKSDGLAETKEPEGFVGELRAYQRRGLSWLLAMEKHGLGACLADDMGLGKTIQVIALMLSSPMPTLLVCPTSVVGNWERELARFGPKIPVVRHHGAQRARTSTEVLARMKPGAVVVTTYALVRRDQALLEKVPWRRIVLDEAQAIKNAGARQSRAVRSLIGAAGGAPLSRFALTGTPIENRLAELWSILDFCNPGLLGSQDGFRRRFALPIERWQDEAVATRLKRVVQPFVLRRLKSDPAVAIQLPEKNEMTVVCTLTREQATLYQAQVDDAMSNIKGATGVTRRGRILALITALKQVCNHPAHFLKAEEAGADPARSGKLTRLVEMLDETLAAGERALVFTQFKRMGDRLVAAMRDRLGEEPLFLHGGVAATDRDEMVERFQSGDPEAPRVFVLSLKAGGLGLNLTAATQVFHFDRWWNPAVEDQATNRAHRIGQTRTVSVYKLVTAGTLEERIDKMLASKRGLADRVLGAGEDWITELSDDDLKQLVSLSEEDVAEEEETAEEAASAASAADAAEEAGA